MSGVRGWTFAGMALWIAWLAPRALAQQSSTTSTGAGSAAPVMLLDSAVPIDPADIVVTTAPLLSTGGFREEVINEVEGRYFGYLLDQAQNDGRWAFTSPAKGFTARYGSRTTTRWPDATRFLYEDSRRNASSLTPILPANDQPESANLRLYHYPARVGFNGQDYETQDTLLAAYVDPQTGKRSTYVYRAVKGTYQLYRLEAGRIPSEPSEASVVSVMEAATTDTIRIRILFANARVAVPRHMYAARVFRSFRGRSYEAAASPLGPPIRFDGMTREAFHAPFEAALQARRQGSPLDPAQFQQAFKLIRQAHRYLVERSKE